MLENMSFLQIQLRFIQLCPCTSSYARVSFPIMNALRVDIWTQTVALPWIPDYLLLSKYLSSIPEPLLLRMNILQESEYTWKQTPVWVIQEKEMCEVLLSQAPDSRNIYLKCTMTTWVPWVHRDAVCNNSDLATSYCCGILQRDMTKYSKNITPEIFIIVPNLSHKVVTDQESTCSDTMSHYILKGTVCCSYYSIPNHI